MERLLHRHAWPMEFVLWSSKNIGRIIIDHIGIDHLDLAKHKLILASYRHSLIHCDRMLSIIDNMHIIHKMRSRRKDDSTHNLSIPDPWLIVYVPSKYKKPWVEKN